VDFGLTAIALVAAALAALRFLRYPAAPRPLRALSRGDFAFLVAVGDATFPGGGSPAASGSDAGIPLYVDRFLAAEPPGPRRLMRLLFFLVEHATLLFPAPGHGGFRRFSRLEPAARLAYLASWQRSRLFARRLVFTSLRAILTMGYLGDASVQRALGLEPPEIEPPAGERELPWPPIGVSE
jgi:hypothetical protein